MDVDLAALEERASALSAEYRADAATLTAYEARMAARRHHALDHQLTDIQQAWTNQEARTRQAKDTLDRIDAVMAEKENRHRRGDDGRTTPQPKDHLQPPSLMFADEHQHPASPAAAAAAASPQSARKHPASPMRSPSSAQRRPGHVNVQNSPQASRHPTVATPQQQASAAAAKVITRANMTNSRLKPGIPQTRFTKRKQPRAKLEEDLDSALTQAQQLINSFMDKV
jgi:hypothetical protein